MLLCKPPQPEGHGRYSPRRLPQGSASVSLSRAREQTCPQGWCEISQDTGLAELGGPGSRAGVCRPLCQGKFHKTRVYATLLSLHSYGVTQDGAPGGFSVSHLSITHL